MALTDFIKDWKGKEVLIIGEALIDKYKCNFFELKNKKDINNLIKKLSI